MTSREKLNNALGIAPESNLDDYLENLSLENNSAQQAMEHIDSQVKETVDNLDKQISEYSKAKDLNQQTLTMVNIKNSLGNIDELITISKDVIKHIYENIASTELIDSELIHAAATFIESCHLNIKEYIDLYKDRLKFYDKIQFEMLQQQHRIELENLKHQHALEKQQSKIEDVPEGMVTWSPEDISKIIG